VAIKKQHLNRPTEERMVILLLWDGGWKHQDTPKDHALQFEFGTKSFHCRLQRFHACLEWFAC
jgi:hypothetical protein